MPSVSLLADHPDLAPLLAHWSYTEWYAHRDIPYRTNVLAYQARAVNRTGIPLSWVAFDRDLPVGMISIKENDLWSRKDLNPWVASLYVIPSHRGRGIGRMLLNSVMSHAVRMSETHMWNYDSLYLFLGANESVDLAAFYRSVGWTWFCDAQDNDGAPTSVYVFSLSSYSA